MEVVTHTIAQGAGEPRDPNSMAESRYGDCHQGRAVPCYGFPAEREKHAALSSSAWLCSLTDRDHLSRQRLRSRDIYFPSPSYKEDVGDGLVHDQKDLKEEEVPQVAPGKTFYS